MKRNETMKNLIQKLKYPLVVIVMTLVPVFAITGLTWAATDVVEGSLCQGGSNVKLGDPANCSTETSGSQDKLNTLITNIVNIISLIVGIVSVVMIVYGGFRYITSGGDSGNVSNAKNTILYAIIGLVIVALAQFIVRFVLSKSTDLTS